MQPLTTICDITTNIDIDTVIVWYDGQRPVAYAYHGGHVVRTTPLDASTISDQVAEIRGAFKVSDGSVFAFGDMSKPAAMSPPVMAPAGVASTMPQRWN
jgi:hypothetical protein